MVIAMLGERIAERIKALDISQSELARRASLPQTTVNSLVKGNRRSSPHLVRLARELHTTPAYLQGETNDPDSDAPEAPPLSAAQRELIEIVDHLSPADQAALLHIARSMAGKASTGTLHSPRSEYHNGG